MSEIIYLSILLIMAIIGIRKNFNNSKWGQFFTCLLFSFLFLGKSLISDWALNEFDFKNQRFLINNSARIVQHLLLILLVIKITYKDHRAILPLVISTVIVVFYCISNMFILSYPLDSVNAVVNGSRDVQKVIYSIKTPLGMLSLLSLLDYGDNVYGKLFRNINISRNTFIGNLLPSFQLTEGNYEIIKKKKVD